MWFFHPFTHRPALAQNTTPVDGFAASAASTTISADGHVHTDGVGERDGEQTDSGYPAGAGD